MTNWTKLNGNLVADPELKVTPNGNEVANFTVAVDDRRKNAEGKYVKTEGKTEFYKVAMLGDLGEKATEELKKGDLVALEGELDTNVWNNKDGIAQSSTTLTARKYEVRFAANEKGKNSGEKE